MKKLNKTFLLTASLLVVCRSAVFGQQVSYTLSQPINSSASFNARDYFRLLPGFSFDPSPGGKTLHLGIDEHILGHATYQSKLQIPNPNRSLNTSYAVGSIVGDVSVSPTGAAVYQIDIDVIPGTAGVQPAISVVYNSQSGNGVVGYGWSLSATSAITRTGSTLYHDNAVRAPNLTTSDNLLLDGQRLMLASGSNLSLSSTYQTEIESYNTITYKYLNSLLSFEVKTTDGWTLQYGSSFDSNIMAAGSSEAHSWLLKKVTDANGNYMTYSYENNTTTGEYRIKQIDYTGNTAAGLVPYNKIEFLYEIRTDSTTHYIENKQIKQRLLIKRIKCSTYGSVVREYKFNYYYDGFFSKLTEVEAYGLDGIRYNSTVVDWGDYGNFNAKTGNEYLSPFSESIGLDHLIYEDFNNDGKTDILSYSPTESISLFLANTAITGGIHFVKQCTIPLGVNFVGMIPAELNGDGLMDVIRVNSSGSSYHYTYYIYNGASFAAMPAPGLSYTFSSSSPPSDVFVGDFNGDGKDEVLVKSGTKLYGENGAEIASGGIGNWGTSYVSSGWLSGLIAERVKVSRRLIDFNGNGKANLLVMGATGFIIYELNDSGTAFYTLYSGPELLCITAGMNKIPLFGDFNGDGKTDILVCKYSTPNEYYILYSTGTEFKKKILPNLNVSGKWFAADFNRDGRSDIIFSPAIGSVCIGLFDGETFQFESHNITLLSGYNLDSNWEKLNFSDFDGDGYPELCYELFSSSFSLKSFTSKQNLFVRTIVNGLNHKSAFTYHPITDNSVSGKSSLAVSYPVSHFCQPLYVVSSWTQQLGNLSETLSYHYKGGKIHRQGKGFLGFDEVTVTNTLQNRKALTQYSYNPIFYHVYPTKQTVTTVAGDSITRTNFQPGLYTTATKVIFPYIAKQTTVDKLTGMSNTVDYVYSAADHGNPSAITKTQGSLTMQMLYTWEAKGGSVYKNRVTQQQTTRQGIGPPFSQIQTFTYDGLARLTQQVDFAGNAKAITTAYTNYDHFGNLKTVTTTAANCPTITTSSIFDATGRFVTSQTDELGKTSYAQYDPKTGVLLEQTDIAGLKTTYLYDGFQQLKQSESPFDKLTYSNSWSISGNNLYTTTATSLVTGSQTILYNAAGQELRTQSPGFSGTVVAENTYNAKGQLYRSYLPGYGNSSPQYIEYDYDTFGRLLSETNIGRTTTYSYNGLTTTVTTPNGKTRATTLNLSGLVAGTTDEAGTAVTYTYNSLGKPVIISAAGDITQITYDDRGFQQSLKDVNIANPIQYVYNAYGQIASQTNEQGQTTTYLYDVAGRLTNQTAPERTLTYQYVPSGYGVGQIQTILENNSTVRSYAYTPFGQVASIAEKIDGIDYTTGYTYNSYGQLTEKQSPSGMRVGYQYNNGLLTTMRNAETNTLLWQANAINALGQVTTGTLGNGLQRVMGYDTYHLPNQIALKDGSTIIDQIDYGYNPVTINLTSRNDISTGRNELFGYDALNRLDSLRINSGILSRMTYYPNGNINTKFNVGTYHYAYSNHAVTGIVGPVSGYTFPTFTLSRTSYNRPSSLLLSVSPAKKIDFVYNPDNQRCKTLYYENN
ncbi:MAG: FG-GAP-like repeat-containing protein, partial [Prevotellaceae bacterium]|nr:FG-GAP-like repeat-containing protein [Prevotellaceae bacterium]